MCKHGKCEAPSFPRERRRLDLAAWMSSSCVFGSLRPQAQIRVLSSFQISSPQRHRENIFQLTLLSVSHLDITNILVYAGLHNLIFDVYHFLRIALVHQQRQTRSILHWSTSFSTASGFSHNPQHSYCGLFSPADIRCRAHPHVSDKAERWTSQRGAVLRLSLSFCLFATLYLNQPDVALRYQQPRPQPVSTAPEIHRLPFSGYFASQILLASALSMRDQRYYDPRGFACIFMASDRV
jgi:hypothetical protein